MILFIMSCGFDILQIYCNCYKILVICLILKKYLKNSFIDF